MSVCYDKLILVLHNTIERFADSQNVKDYMGNFAPYFERGKCDVEEKEMG